MSAENEDFDIPGSLEDWEAFRNGPQWVYIKGQLSGMLDALWGQLVESDLPKEAVDMIRGEARGIKDLIALADDIANLKVTEAIEEMDDVG